MNDREKETQEKRTARKSATTGAGRGTSRPAPGRSKPPIRQKSSKYTIKRLRLRTPDVLQAEAVAEQQGIEFIDLSREQYQRGVFIDAALRPPTPDGMAGLYSAQRLAELLRFDLDGLINFALQQGVVPTIIQEYRILFQTLAAETHRQQKAMGADSRETPKPVGADLEQTLVAATEVAEEAQGVLGMFFPETDRNDYGSVTETE